MSRAAQIRFYMCVFALASVWLADNVDCDESVEQVYSDHDETSCICGVNRHLLDKLESLLNQVGELNLCPEKNVTGGDATNDLVGESDTHNQTISSDDGPANTTEAPAEEHDEHDHTIAMLEDEIKRLEEHIAHLKSRNVSKGTAHESGRADKPLDEDFFGKLPQTVNSTLAQLVGVPASPAAVQDALVSTVPNVVSNIFSNIEELANLTQLANASSTTTGRGNDNNQTAAGSSGAQLTSIDGSSVNVAGDSVDQIKSDGEKLFLQWVEHQLNLLHLTASVANHIRKSALSLFRRIVKQYVARLQNVGGRVDENVRKATQIALANTQHIVSFMLRNYINVAGGFMQIIGEQVSRVGKQLDNTGGTIAHVNLNPFDIVSNVIDSLPNPSRYSEYFRNIGRYVMGEINHLEQQTFQGNKQNQTDSGLVSATLGTIGKTLGSWWGRR